MTLQWSKLKQEAINLRLQGKSVRDIEKRVHINRSTLSGWFKNINLTEEQNKKLQENWKNALVHARGKAVVWHNEQKALRIKTAQKEANQTLNKINPSNNYVLELALAMLYLGEGSKTNTTGLGNSNPLILKFFVKSIERLFGLDRNILKCDLHLRSDQDKNDAIEYWSKELSIPKNNFIAMKDKRVAKSKTYSHYKGVCVVQCGRIAIQRRLVHLAEEFSKITVGSQV